ncbi:MAG: hypothetical protein LQ352_002031 [Teloschistes flavicans]|nr:MAG: hypothetical protein LQ352_002031 [Teloschistes flavicans]
MTTKQHTSTFSSRAENEALPALASYLLSLISIKQSNLCVSADVHTTSALLRLADEVGDSICVLKTHADIIDDFSDRTIKGLQEIATRKHFLIFEDRKFGDIGNTVQSQYSRGPLRIATWAHLTNAHIFPGPAIIPSLQFAAHSTLISLNQSVSTEISIGTPRGSIDGSTTGTDLGDDVDPLASSISASAHQPESIQQQNQQNGTLSPTNPNFDMSHRRTSIVTATTTISQTFEPSPPNPATLSRTLSSSSGDKPFDRDSALVELGAPPHARGLFLLAEMSSEGNLMNPQYTSACLSSAREHRDFVLGFVAQHNITQRDKGDEFLVFVPGVSFADEDGKASGDGKGQRWREPYEVVQQGADVVIVGRGVLNARDRGKEAERYRREAWRGYEDLVRGVKSGKAKR